jgi:polysaccharide biosynthesis transport protein
VIPQAAGKKMSEEFEERSARTWGEYWTILLRRRWWILVPLFFVWAAVWAISWLLPVEYQSESVLGVDRQRVTEQYVTPDVPFNLPDWLQTTTQQILTRPRLQEMMDQFQLSRGAGAWGMLFEGGDPVDRMRQSIQIEPIDSPGHPGTSNAFRILTSAGSREAAREVNEEVMSLFIAENAMSERQRSAETSTFLDDELARSREEVTAQEAKITAFQEQHLGQLPSQLQGNVQILSELQTELQGLQRALDAARQQKLYLDSLLQEYRSAQSNASAGSPDSQAAQSLDKELMDLRLKLETLRSEYTEDYPDIGVVKQEIEKTEALRKRLGSQAGAVEPGDRAVGSEAFAPASTTDGQQPTPPSIMQAQSQLKANALEIQNDLQRERDLESQIATYRGRLNLAPATEQALDELSSGYEQSKRNYDSLLQKQMQSHLAASLEEKQGGEQLQVLDPPSLPQRPSSPNRLRISLAGLVMGLAIGLGLAIVRELTDVRVHADEELSDVVPAPMLVAIPRLSSPRENALLHARMWIEVVAATLLVALIVAGNLCSLYKG